MRSSLFLGLGLGAQALSPAFAASHTVTVNTVQIFGTIDPAKISDYTDYMASANLYDGLANVDPNGDLVPELAEKWDVSPDATSVTFHIRPDAKFQDGSPVEAEDVVNKLRKSIVQKSVVRFEQPPRFREYLRPVSLCLAPDLPREVERRSAAVVAELIGGLEEALQPELPVDNGLSNPLEWRRF